MKFASFIADGAVRAGVVVQDEIVDLAVADAQLAGPLADLLAHQPDLRERLDTAISSGIGRLSLASVQLTAPVRPTKFFAVGLNYADHVTESGVDSPESLMVFPKAVSCVTGPYDPILRPVVSDQLDYEGELGIVIGHRCRHVARDEAPGVIGGYTIVNDVSVRDWQVMTSQWALGKSFDTHGPIGPYVVTEEELGDPHALDLRTYVNGELRQSSNTRNFIFDCYEIVRILSQVCTLEPGDVIATGTPGGVAIALDGQPWLVPGDRVRIEVDGIGFIENEVVQEVLPGEPPKALAA